MKSILIILLFISSATQAAEVKLLTWNVFMLPKPIKFTLQEERTEIITNQLLKSNYDIVLLQEAFSGDFQRTLKKKTIKKFPYQYYLGREPGTLTVYGSGLYYMSRFPMKELIKGYYKECKNADCFASKGLAVMEISLPSGEKLQIGNTHLQASKELSEIRFKQLSMLKSLFLVTEKPGIPQVLAGDLNIDALHGSDFSKALTFLNMKSHPLEGELKYTNGYAIDCYKKPGDDQQEWLDHILVNNKSSMNVSSKYVKPFSGTINNRDCPLSDHYGVEATLKW